MRKAVSNRRTAVVGTVDAGRLVWIRMWMSVELWVVDIGCHEKWRIVEDGGE